MCQSNNESLSSNKYLRDTQPNYNNTWMPLYWVNNSSHYHSLPITPSVTLTNENRSKFSNNLSHIKSTTNRFSTLSTMPCQFNRTRTPTWLQLNRSRKQPHSKKQCSPRHYGIQTVVALTRLRIRIRRNSRSSSYSRKLVRSQVNILHPAVIITLRPWRWCNHSRDNQLNSRRRYRWWRLINMFYRIHRCSKFRYSYRGSNYRLCHHLRTYRTNKCTL